MKFSLFTLILILIWFATTMLVWQRRQAWVPDIKTYALTDDRWMYDNSDVQEFSIKSVPHMAPDKSRVLTRNENFIVISDNNQKELYTLSDTGNEHRLIVPLGFSNDDQCAVVELSSEGEKVRVWYRRFPEWWWGHLYRPEVWALIGLTLVIAWRGVKRFRSLRATP